MTARATLATSFALLLSISSLYAAAPDVQPGPGATILCYHIVESPQDPRMEISRETFKQQLRYLEMTGYTVIPLRQLYEYVAGKRATLPKNSVVITIDDGWRSTYTEAYPELKKRHFPFTVFVYPRIIGQTSHALTWKQVREMSNAGVDIQSHSLSHPFLTHRRHATFDERQYAEWLDKELLESKQILEKETGKNVSFLAYPYGDYDSRVSAAAAKLGYAGGLTCDYGRVRRGSDPLKMRRVAIEKRMDFATFRSLLGAGSMHLDHETPLPGQIIDPGQGVISAKIASFRNLDPKSVGMALLGLSDATPYSYDPSDGSITLLVKDVSTALKGKYQRALVWATDMKSGKRVEATWTFRLPEPPAPTTVPVIPAPCVDATCDPKPSPDAVPVPTAVESRAGVISPVDAAILTGNAGANPGLQRQPK